MHTITTFLMFKTEAEEAAGLYVSLFSSVFGNSQILSVSHYSKEELDALKNIPGMDLLIAGSADTVKAVSFTLNGQEFLAANGGGQFGKFSESLSLFVSCDTQEQIDTLTEKLAEGGVKQPFGWLKDRFGVSWQILPASIGKSLSA